jgi:hypothetical protein
MSGHGAKFGRKREEAIAARLSNVEDAREHRKLCKCLIMKGLHGASWNSGKAASHYDLMDLDRGLPAVRDSRLTPLLSGAMNVLIRAAVNTMLETKFLRLRTPVELGSRLDDWQVCWLGGWGKHDGDFAP